MSLSRRPVVACRTSCWFLAGVLATVLLVAGSKLEAQVPFSACLDRQDQPIEGIVDNDLPYAAEATFKDGRRVIIWNAHNLAGSSTVYQLFVYLHECAHHSLNHLYRGESRSIEDQADCWAYQLLSDGDMISGSRLDALVHELKQTRGDANHLGGEALVSSVQGCVELRADPAAWDSALTTLTAAAPAGFADIQGPRIPDAPGEAYETTRGAPGTFDCELLKPPAVRCLLFATRKQKAAEQRFERIARIIRNWLPSDWTSTEPHPAPASLARALLAQDGNTGTTMVLGLTPTARVYFMVKTGAKS